MTDREVTSVPGVSSPGRAMLVPVEIGAIGIISALMVIATGWHWWPLGWVEVAGFVTGGISVWLTVREHLWLWPIGLANNVLFFALFWHGRLYADALLQIVYIALGSYGWWNWLYGGRNRTELRVSRTKWWEWIGVGLFLVAGTFGLREILIRAQDAAPLYDGLTTALSLAAQYLLCRKRLENWFIWITADVIYVPLYLSRALPLIAFLYFVFLLMCIAGLVQWRKRYQLVALRGAI